MTINRADLGVAFSTGHKTLFFFDGISYRCTMFPRRKRPYTIEPQKQSLTSQKLGSNFECFFYDLDIGLRLIWYDLSALVQVMNTMPQPKPQSDYKSCKEAIVTIHYRLVDVRYDVDSIDEALRLALLAFSSTLFVQWRGIRTRYEYLAQSFRSALSLLKREATVLPTELSLWLYVVGIIAVFGDQEQNEVKPVLNESLQIMELKSWNDVRSSLKSILWVDMLHDPPAERMIKAILAES